MLKNNISKIVGGQLKILTKEQIRSIDYAAKEILWRTGIKLDNSEALGILEEAGATVDYKNERTWIPPYLIDEAVRKTPKSFRYAGRDPKKFVRLDTERLYIVCGVGPYIVDVDGTLKKPTVKDVQDRFRVADACENIDASYISLGSGPSVPKEDMSLPLAVRRVRGYLRALDFTEKPVDTTKTYVWDREESARISDKNAAKQAVIDQLNMEIAVRGSIEELRKLPMSFILGEPVSPLWLQTVAAERIIMCGRHGLPLYVGSGPMTNATGPATLAGTLALWTAETLSCLVLGAMAVDDGHRAPSIWSTWYGPFDQLAMHGGAQGSPEAALIQGASAQIAHFYGFPIRGVIDSESKLPDAQAGYETGVALLVSALAGINWHTSTGVIGPGEIGMSLEKIVLDNDLAGYVKRILKGIKVNDETLAVDVIDEVGPGGTFLAHPHTRKWFRKEQYFPTIFDRRKYEDWVRQGRKDAVQRATERVQEILRDHWPEPLDLDIRKRMEEYVKKVEKREAKKT
jgi:trimethylamine--corrinoid protein Co-methyltransferase